LQGCIAVTGFVTQVVRYPTVGIDIEEMLAQAFGKEPCGDGKVLVMRASQALTVDLGLLQRRSDSGNGVFRGEKVPGLIRSAHEQSAFSSQQSHSAISSKRAALNKLPFIPSISLSG
jgi:hypothetical protein